MSDSIIALRIRRIGHFEALAPEDVRADIDYNPEHQQFLLWQEDRYGDGFYTAHRTFNELAVYAADELDGWPRFKVYDLDNGQEIPTKVYVTVERG